MKQIIIIGPSKIQTEKYPVDPNASRPSHVDTIKVPHLNFTLSVAL